MPNVRKPSLFARIARRCRVAFVAALAIGMIVTAVHADITRATGFDGQSANLLVNSQPWETNQPMAGAALAVTCPSQTACHHGQPLYLAVADTPDRPTQGAFRRLMPGRIQAAGHRGTLDHPPPIF